MYAALAAVLVSAHVARGGEPGTVGVGSGHGSSLEIVYRSSAALRSALTRYPAIVVRVVRPLHVAEVRPQGNTRAFLSALRGSPGITVVRLAAVRTATVSGPALTLGRVSTPAGGAYEWQYYATHSDRVPDPVRAAAGRIKIAVLDTGADSSVPGLSGKIAASYDVRRGRRGTTDVSGHGTFVASLAAGSDGVAGFGGSARLLVVKVAEGSTFNDIDVAAGIIYAVRHGAQIINLSVSGRTRSPVEQRAVEYAAKRGVLLIAAAGNDALAGNPPEYPAALLQPLGSNGVGGHGLTVGASDFAGNRASFSEFGSFVSLAAPGTLVFGAVAPRSSSTTFPRTALLGAPGLYGFASGTSFAAPQVAGAAALIWATAPRLSARQVAEILKQTASGHGTWEPGLGFGVLDVAAAVDAAGRAVLARS